MLNMLSKREKRFLFNFLSTKSGDKTADAINFGHDLELYGYDNTNILENLFFHFNHSDVLHGLNEISDKEVESDE
jgi:hypothetical protein